MNNNKKKEKTTSSQDGGIDEYTLLSCTNKRRTTTNLKTKNNQNCQKIKVYGSPTTKELKKKHPFRPLGRAEMGSQVERTHCKAAARGWRTGAGKVAAGGPGKAAAGRVGQVVPHLCANW